MHCILKTRSRRILLSPLLSLSIHLFFEAVTKGIMNETYRGDGVDVAQETESN